MDSRGQVRSEVGTDKSSETYELPWRKMNDDAGLLLDAAKSNQTGGKKHEVTGARSKNRVRAYHLTTNTRAD